MILNLFRWIAIIAIAFLFGKLIQKIKLPAISGWLIAGMIFIPHAVGLMTEEVMSAEWYKITVTWMQCAFGLMLEKHSARFCRMLYVFALCVLLCPKATVPHTIL